MTDAPVAAGRRLLIIGGGVAGRELTRRLAGSWQMTLLEGDAAKAERLAADLDPSVSVEYGDGTSELVLRRIGVAEADAVVLATRDDEANVLAARLARERFECRRVVALVGDAADPAALRNMGVEVVQRGDAVATALVARLSPDRIAAAHIGLGKGELVEVTLLPTSPLVGLPLSASSGMGWRVGALYRADELIVPSGDTVPRVGDRVILVAQPEQMSAVAEFISAGSARFPLRYGRRIGLVVDAAGIPPGGASQLVSRLSTHGLVVFGAAEAGRAAIESLFQIRCEFVANSADSVTISIRRSVDHGLGLIIMPLPAAEFGERLGLNTNWSRLLDEARIPLLVPRRNVLPGAAAHFGRVLLAASGGRAGASAAECAFDAARTLGLPLAAVAVAPPKFVGGSEAGETTAATLRHLAGLAELYHLRIETEQAVGNPVREVLRRARPDDIVVVGRVRRRRRSFFRPDVAMEIARRAECSTLIVPNRHDE